MTMTVKPRWLDPVLPSEAEYRKLRLVANNTTIRDFDAKITCVDNNGHFWVQRLDQLGALTSVESQIEAVYLLTKRKFQDDTWYINEPCIAQFYHDKRWYRGLIKAINDTVRRPLVVIFMTQARFFKNQTFHFLLCFSKALSDTDYLFMSPSVEFLNFAAAKVHF